MQRFGSQHGNGSQTMLRSARNMVTAPKNFYTTIPINSEYFEKKDLQVERVGKGWS